MAAAPEVHAYQVYPMSRIPMRVRKNNDSYARNTRDATYAKQLSPLQRLQQDYQEKLLLEKEKKISDMYERRNDEALAKVRKYSGKRSYNDQIAAASNGHRQVKNLGSYAESHNKRAVVSAAQDIRIRKPQKLPPIGNIKKSSSYHTINNQEPFAAHAPVEKHSETKSNSVREEPEVKDAYSRISPPPNVNHLRLLREKRQRHKQLQQQEYQASREAPSAAKLTDFEKWQQEQDEKRLARLERHRLSQFPHSSTDDRPNEIDYSDKSRRDPAVKPQMSKKVTVKRPTRRDTTAEINRREILRQGVSSTQRIAELEKEILRKQMDLQRIQEGESSTKSSSGYNYNSENDSDHESHYPTSYAPISKPVKVTSKRPSHEHKTNTSPYGDEAEVAFQRKPVLVRRDASQGSSRGRLTPQPDRTYAENKRNSRKSEKKKTSVAPTGVSKKKANPQMNAVETFSHNHTSAYPIEKISEEERNVELNLKSCDICGRKFAVDRLEKHSRVCSKNQVKKRKVFDMTKARTHGTDAEKFVKRRAYKRSPTPPVKKSDWRRKHEDFISTIRNAKQVSDHIARGGKATDLPPPPPSENPDYVKCQYCQRRFNPTVAERHIPRCKDIKSRPKPPKRK